MTSVRSDATPWWQEIGSETCDFCHHRLHYDAGYHCAFCDRWVCTHCVIRTPGTALMLCPECAEEEGIGKDSTDHENRADRADGDIREDTP